MKKVAEHTERREGDKIASELVDKAEVDDSHEKDEPQKSLGLDGEHVFSQEAKERKKAQDVKQAKNILQNHRERGESIVQTFKHLFDRQDESTVANDAVFRLIMDRMDAGKHVISIFDTTGSSQKDEIILSPDLSLLKSKTNAGLFSKMSISPENGFHEGPKPQRTIYGVIKLFISHVHNCTIVVRCKLISGTIEMNHCSNVTLKIEQEATVATVQVDVSQDVAIEFHDAASGKNTNLTGKPKMFWGDDRDDRIFHAGVKDMRVAIFRDGTFKTELRCDYIKDGAISVGDASAEEFQFVTSIVEGKFQTEQVIRHGSVPGTNARAMTQRDIDQMKVRRENVANKVAAFVEDMIKIVDKNGNEVVKTT